MQRTHWVDLPDQVRDAIQAHTGPVLDAHTASAGLNSEVAAILHTAAGRVFAKGLRADHPRVWTQQREKIVASHVSPVAPRLLWHVETGGWNILGFEHIDGRHADYTPGSPDLAKVVDVIGQLAEIRCPADVPVKRAEQRWADHLDDPAELEMFAGDALLHTDYNPCNVLISHKARLIDWAWPTRGAAWIDPACLIVRLMAAGHTAADAEGWARRVPSWTAAPREAVDTFATALSRMWDEIAHHDPSPWKQDMAAVAQQWLTYRLS